MVMMFCDLNGNLMAIKRCTESPTVIQMLNEKKLDYKKFDRRKGTQTMNAALFFLSSAQKAGYANLVLI